MNSDMTESLENVNIEDSDPSVKMYDDVLVDTRYSEHTLF